MGRCVGRFRSWLGSETARIAILLCLVGIVTRVPFRAQILHHWDSVNFALALDHFDVRLHQPHPPGTFVIYIMLGRLLNALLHDPNASLVWLSVLMSGLGTGVLFLLSEEWFGRRVGLTTALLAIVSPLVWFHGEVALSYMLEFFWVPVVVIFCYRLQTRSWWAVLASALLIGMAGGIRPNTPVFLFPLWAVGVIVHKYPFKKILVALLVMGLGVLIWAIPMVMMSGGLMEYIEVMRWWQNQHTEESASLAGTTENVIRFGMYAVYALGLGLIPLVAAACCRLSDIVRSLKRDWRAQTLAVWILPAAGYFTIVHLRQPGHTFTIQPAFLLLSGLAIVSLACKKASFRRNAWVGLTVVVVSVNALFFLVGPTYLFGDTRMLFTTPTWNAIHDYDAYVTVRLNTIRDTFSPEETAVLASGRSFRLADFYLPDFQLPSLSHQINSSSVTLAYPVNTLVLFDDSVLPELPADVAAQSVSLPNAKLLRYITWDENQVVELSGDWLEVRDQ
jgi:hypothetical protein